MNTRRQVWIGIAAGVALLGLWSGGPPSVSGQGMIRATHRRPVPRPGEEAYPVATSPAAPAPLRTLPLVGSALAVDEAAGRVFVASATGQSVATLDARNGALLRTIHTTGMPTAIAVDALSGRVFVTSRLDAPSAPGIVTVLDARSGCVLGVVYVDATPTAVATDALVGHAFVASGVGSDSRVSMLDTHHGRVLRRVRVGSLPVSVAVDAAAPASSSPPLIAVA